MSEVKGHKSFQEVLSGLTVTQQRQIGARFIANVLDLTDEPRLKGAQQIAAKSGVTAEELVDAYHAVHAIYTQTHPRSDLSELDYTKQAVHFIAEACGLSITYLSRGKDSPSSRKDRHVLPDGENLCKHHAR